MKVQIKRNGEILKDGKPIGALTKEKVPLRSKWDKEKRCSWITGGYTRYSFTLHGKTLSKTRYSAFRDALPEFIENTKLTPEWLKMRHEPNIHAGSSVNIQQEEVK